MKPIHRFFVSDEHGRTEVSRRGYKDLMRDCNSSKGRHRLIRVHRRISGRIIFRTAHIEPRVQEVQS